MMETTTQLVWWVGLVGALLLTLIILKEVALLHKVLRDIFELAKRTRDASLGIAAHTVAAQEVAGLSQTASALPPAARNLAAAAERVKEALPYPAGKAAGKAQESA